MCIITLFYLIQYQMCLTKLKKKYIMWNNALQIILEQYP